MVINYVMKTLYRALTFLGLVFYSWKSCADRRASRVTRREARQNPKRNSHLLVAAEYWKWN